jgi:phospho-N-acetylmuramoyl-pentapeptide-transferase
MNELFPIIVRILVPSALAFSIGIALTPIVLHYLYHFKVWKKKGGKHTLDGEVAHEFNRLHEHNETRVPRMGGIVVWGSVILTALGISALALILQDPWITRLNFLSRNQTWIPLAALLVGAIAGFVDDLLMVQPQGKGLRLRVRLAIVVALSSAIGFWFYDKLDVTAINIPFSTPIEIGWLIIPFFILMSLALYASGVIDGVDGLSGGVFASIFSSYAVIFFALNQIDLAAFSMAIVGGLLAFLWFNIPPARFYMSDTGTMALTLTLATLAFMSDNLGGGVGIAVLPIIGGLLVVTVASDILQVFWKRFYGRKLFRIAPLHHHFEAIGWSPAKVTMRYWVVSVILATLGVIVALSAQY